MEHTAQSLLADVPDVPDHETRRLLLAAAGAETAWLLGNPVVGTETVARFRRLVERRRRGEPIQYIEGWVQFGPLVLRSDDRALVPRPETERLWEISTDLIRGLASPVIVDLCTGSGNLALACKSEFPFARVIGTDISAAALSLAVENAGIVGLDVEFCRGDLFTALPTELCGQVDLVVSNPPYIAFTDVGALPIDVREFEPREALVSGRAGTEMLARIAAAAMDWLRPGGLVACEIGETQGEQCLELFAGYEPRVARDLADRPRYIIGSAPRSRDLH